MNSVNRAVLYDLYPYVWDLRNTLLVAKAFISWLGEWSDGGRRGEEREIENEGEREKE